MSSMLVMAWLTIVPITFRIITLPFAALLLRQGELEDLRQLVNGIALWWPQAEAQLRQGNEWPVLEPVLTTFTRFLNNEKQLLKAI